MIGKIVSVFSFLFKNFIYLRGDERNRVKRQRQRAPPPPDSSPNAHSDQGWTWSQAQSWSSQLVSYQSWKPGVEPRYSNCGTRHLDCWAKCLPFVSDSCYGVMEGMVEFGVKKNLISHKSTNELCAWKTIHWLSAHVTLRRVTGRGNSGALTL